MTKYVIFTQHVSRNTILLSSFQNGGFFVLVIVARPNVRYFQKLYFNKVSIITKRRRNQLTFSWYLFLLFVKNT